MTITLSRPALFVLHTLQQAGFEAYIVGGAVRDLLLAAENPGAVVPEIDTTDYDFTTNARPEQIQALFPNHFYENDFGTVSVTHQHLLKQMGLEVENVQELHQNTPASDKPKVIDILRATKIHESLSAEPSDSSAPTKAPVPSYQITTFRSDEVYDDFRKPSSMNWGNSLEEDLERRDFTINAMALTVTPEVLSRLLIDNVSSHQVSLQPKEYHIVDRYNGLEDLRAKIIRAVGNPPVRFQEDALRMLRAIRFSVQLNMGIEDETFDALQQNAPLLKHISGERIRDEFLKMLASDFPAEAVELLDEARLLEYVLPELLEAKGVKQGGHHTTDVWVHSLDALRCCPSSDPIVRLATLIHDIAKPRTYKVIDGQITFYNHEIVGSRMASRICQRLRLSRHETDRVFALVRYHMFHYQPTMTDAAIRRFMRKVGLTNIDDILDLREGDRLGSGARKTSWRLEEMKQRMIDQLHQPMEVRDLAINGHDLMNELGLKPGPELGRILKELFEQVLDNPELNTREQLLELAKKLK